MFLGPKPGLLSHRKAFSHTDGTECTDYLGPADMAEITESIKLTQRHRVTQSFFVDDNPIGLLYSRIKVLFCLKNLKS